MKRSIAVLLLATAALAQQPITPVSDKEQAEFLRKRAQLLQVQQELTVIEAKLYSDRKLTPADATLCFGPGQGPCANVPDYTLMFVAAPKVEAKPADKK